MNYRAFSEIMWARRWVVLAVLIAVLVASPLFIKVIRPTYQATANLALIQDDSGKSSVIPSDDLPSLVTSVEVARRVKEKLQLSDSVDTLRGQISAKIAPKSSILPITYRNKDKRLALAVPNVAADETVAYYRELATRQYSQLIASLREQMATQQNAIRAIDARLQTVVVADSFAASDNALNTISTRLDELESQRSQAQATLVADRASAGAEANKGGLGSVISEQALASDPYYQALRAGQAKDAAEYAFEKAGYTEAYPGLPGLAEKVGRETAAVDQATAETVARHRGASSTYSTLLIDQRHADAQVAGDRARVDSIAQQISTTQQRLRDLPKTGVTADALRLQREAASDAYKIAAQRLQTTLANQAEAASLSSVVVVDHAISASARMSALTISILIGLLVVALSIGAAYLAESLDPRIRTAKDIEELYGTPQIGSISS